MCYRPKTIMERLKAETFVNNLLSTEALNTPSDPIKPDDFVMELPIWFDEKKFNRGRKFFHEFQFGFASSMLLGVVAIFSIPSGLRILVSTRRSNSPYTAYKRYVSTILHIMSWFEHELKPGSLSWKSMMTVRDRHIRATQASKVKGIGLVSQRDVALTQFGLSGFGMLRPDVYSITQVQDGDWEAYTHVWRVIGYMLGLEDRYNVCQETLEETLEVCQLLMSRVFAPCLENPPEYFEHAARVMLDGLWSVNPLDDMDAVMWWTKYMAGIPGYMYSESDRRKLQERLREKMKGNLNNGIDIKTLMEKPAVEGLPDLPPRLLYYSDYNSLDSAPEYKELSNISKYKMFRSNLLRYIYGSNLGRWCLNIYIRFSMVCVQYFPYLAFLRFGVKASFVNMFEEGPKDDSKLKLNAEYKVNRNSSWYEWLVAVFW